MGKGKRCMTLAMLCDERGAGGMRREGCGLCWKRRGGDGRGRIIRGDMENR